MVVVAVVVRARMCVCAETRLLLGAHPSLLSLGQALLILDEPCQGLDLVHRRRVLSLVERVCSHTDTSLVYVTHYYEEVLPCVTHVLHLQDGEAIFCGDRAAYEESALPQTSARTRAP